IEKRDSSSTNFNFPSDIGASPSSLVASATGTHRCEVFPALVERKESFYRENLGRDGEENYGFG
ncbi:Hypothetical predicted protein, partial [Olea europaea subsp. europaea]